MRIFNTNINRLKILCCLYFIIPGFINLVHTLINFSEYFNRDIIILLVLSSPLLINKRFFYTFFGLIASIVSLLVLILFVVNNSPTRIDISTWMYITGCAFYFFGVVCGLGMIYIGTHSKQKNTFQIV